MIEDAQLIQVKHGNSRVQKTEDRRQNSDDPSSPDGYDAARPSSPDGYDAARRNQMTEDR